MQIKYKLVLAFGLLPFFANAQSINTKVFDSRTLEPVVGATIKLPKSGKSFKTNYEGQVNLQANTGDTALVSSVGYKLITMVLSAPKTAVALQTDPMTLQAVIVTANREKSARAEAPMAISKLSQKIIDEAKPTAMYEVVNKTPGVFMVDLGNEQHMMSIRQPMTTNAYYLYMEDGVPIRPMGVFNHNALLQVNQFAISNIEVVKGPVSSIYGPEAVGGAINFITQRATALPTVKIGSQLDNWGYRRVQFGAGATLGKFGFYVGGLTSRQTNSWMAASDYDKTAINARLEYSFSQKTRLTGTFIYGKYNAQTGGSVDSVAFFNRSYSSTTDFTYRLSDANRSRLTLDHEWTENGKSTFTLFNRNDKLGQNPSYGIRWTSGKTTATGEINQNSFESYGAMAQHTQKFNWLNSKLTAGALFDYSPTTYWSYLIDLNAQLRPDGKSVEQYTIAAEHPDNKLSDYTAKIKSMAAYAQYELSPVKNLHVVTGLRYDRMAFSYNNFLDQSSGDKSYSQATPKLGLTYQVTPTTGAYANFATGFSPPALTAIFRKRPNTTPTSFYYNLKPASFNNYEVGAWTWLANNKLYADIALYIMNGRDELLNIRQADNSYDYQSAGKTVHRGVELGLTYKPSSQVNLRAGATYAQHKFEDFLVSNRQTDAVQNLANYNMPSAPNWIWNTEAYYYPKFAKNLRLSAEWQHLSDYYQNQINTIKYQGFDLINCRVGYQWKGIEIYANVMNVGNSLYAVNATRGNGATDRTNYTAAAPRTYVLGLQYNFIAKH